MVKTAFFVCNSPKDGFREGDGDLMDKITRALNQPELNRVAVRIVGETPPADISRSEQELVVLDHLPEPERQDPTVLHPDQLKLVDFIQTYSAQHKILYIGSRIDNFRQEKRGGFTISVGSGAFINEDVILALKKHGVKIVVCCLEIVFHSRSLHHAFRLYETIRHHLQHADAIHYLTERDKEYVETQIPELLRQGKRLVHSDYPVQDVEKVLFKKRIKSRQSQDLDEVRTFVKTYFSANAQVYHEYFKWFHRVELIDHLWSIPGFYAPGICTINRLTAEQLCVEDPINRPGNVLVFGLIRSHKGIEEGLALGKLLQERQRNSQVYIVGKIINLTCILKRIFLETFDEFSLQELGINIKDRLSVCHRAKDLNLAFQALFDDLVQKGVRKKANVILKLNVAEEDLLQYSRLCRYALKLDVKGFAENASSMISTLLGLGLPVIAQGGLVTPSSVQTYAPALHLLSTGLVLHRDEIKPTAINLSEVLAIVEESDSAYQLRLDALHRILESGQFSLENTVALLLKATMSLINPDGDLKTALNRNRLFDSKPSDGWRMIKLPNIISPSPAGGVAGRQ